MIESRWNPSASIVAELTGLRKPAGYVVRIRCAIEVFDVARSARRAEPDEYSRGVASGTGCVDVCSRERERGLGMIEDRTGPIGRGVTNRAVRGKPGSFVIWIARLIVNSDMTRSTVFGRTRVLTVDVTL